MFSDESAQHLWTSSVDRVGSKVISLMEPSSNVSAHHQRAIRSISATARRRSSSRSDSSSPFRRVGSGLLSVLRHKFSLRIARGDGGDTSRCHGGDDLSDPTVTAGTSATLCSSWRSRPRHVDKPIRPAYSDECLSCCGRLLQSFFYSPLDCPMHQKGFRLAFLNAR